MSQVDPRLRRRKWIPFERAHEAAGLPKDRWYAEFLDYVVAGEVGVKAFQVESTGRISFESSTLEDVQDEAEYLEIKLPRTLARTRSAQVADDAPSVAMTPPPGPDGFESKWDEETASSHNFLRRPVPNPIQMRMLAGSCGEEYFSRDFCFVRNKEVILWSNINKWKELEPHTVPLSIWNGPQSVEQYSEYYYLSFVFSKYRGKEYRYTSSSKGYLEIENNKNRDWVIKIYQDLHVNGEDVLRLWPLYVTDRSRRQNRGNSRYDWEPMFEALRRFSRGKRDVDPKELATEARRFWDDLASQWQSRWAEMEKAGYRQCSSWQAANPEPDRPSDRQIGNKLREFLRTETHTGNSGFRS